MNMRLFNQRRSCHEAGVCQRTAPQCHRVCHLATPDRNGPPIGYEAARESNVHQLHAERCAAARAQEPAEEPPIATSWCMGPGLWILGAGLLLALIGLIAISAANPQFLLTDLRHALASLKQLFSAIGWAAMRMEG